MTNFSFEVPIKHLEVFEDLQDFHFVLNDLLKYGDYLNFYLKHRNHGKQIWLDNGYNELRKSATPSNLIQNIELLGADRVICPDDPSWSSQEILTSATWMRHFNKAHTLIVVTNSPSILTDAKDLNFQHFAISYHVRGPIYEKFEDEHVLDWASDLHFLGLQNINEVLKLQPPTLDTSMPIKLAIQGKSIQNWIFDGCPHIHTRDMYPSFFELEMTRQQIYLARDNILYLKECVR